MTVVFVPDFSDANPYQSNLAAELEASGESVVMGKRGGVFPIIRSCRENGDVSVVHVHWLDPYLFGSAFPITVVKALSTLVELFVLKLLGVSLVWTCHNVSAHESPHPRVERAFKRVFVRSGLCDRVFVHCEAMKADIVTAYDLPGEARSRMVVVEHGHYIDDYENGVDRATARAELDIDPSERVFLFFGQIRPYKGVFELIEAFRAVADTGSRLLIAGKPQTDAIRARLEATTRNDDRIDLALGFVPDDRVRVYMGAADAVVLPFRHITTSGSAVLAMSFRRALVVPRLGCIPEMLDDEGAILYDPDDPDALSAALRAAESRDLGRMGEHNYRLARSRDWETVANRTAAVYRDLQSGRSGMSVDF